jgi:hypothetical protein
VPEHASKILGELFFILLRIAAESITLLATPNELLRLAVEDINDQCADLCDISCGTSARANTSFQHWDLEKCPHSLRHSDQDRRNPFQSAHRESQNCRY